MILRKTFKFDAKQMCELIALRNSAKKIFSYAKKGDR